MTIQEQIYQSRTSIEEVQRNIRRMQEVLEKYQTQLGAFIRKYAEATVPDGYVQGKLEMSYSGSHPEYGYDDETLLVAVPDTGKTEFRGSYISEMFPEEFLPKGSYVFNEDELSWDPIPEE